uniref:ARAD1B21384p n=1 Tax=Blastobotrys adeninivorans TaxID=409370 RepID=A0A060T7P4_BLAAD
MSFSNPDSEVSRRSVSQPVPARPRSFDPKDSPQMNIGPSSPALTNVNDIKVGDKELGSHSPGSDSFASVQSRPIESPTSKRDTRPRSEISYSTSSASSHYDEEEVNDEEQTESSKKLEDPKDSGESKGGREAEDENYEAEVVDMIADAKVIDVRHYRMSSQAGPNIVGKTTESPRPDELQQLQLTTLEPVSEENNSKATSSESTRSVSPLHGPSTPPNDPAGLTNLPNMSRQSVLDAFENDIRDLLLLEKNPSDFANLNFDQLKISPSRKKSEAMESNPSFHSNKDYPSPSPQEDTENTSPKASKSDLTPKGAPSTPGRKSDQENPVRAPKLDSPIHTKSNSSDRMSRSTINTLQAQEILEYGMKTNHVARPSAASTSTGSHPHTSIEGAPGRSFSISSRDKSQSHSALQHSNSKVARMGSEVELRMKRGRLSLRRKSTNPRMSNIQLTRIPSPELSTYSGPRSSTLDALISVHVDLTSQRAPAPPSAPSKGEDIAQWFLDQVVSSKTHHAGAFITPALLLPSSLWNMDSISHRALEPRIRGLRALTAIAGERVQNVYSSTVPDLEKVLQRLEFELTGAFSVPMDFQHSENQHNHQSPPPQESPRRRSSTALSLTPTFSQNSSLPFLNAGSRASGVFKRLRKRSMLSSSTEDQSEPSTPTEEPDSLKLDHYLSAISSVSKALQSLRQLHMEDSRGMDREAAEWIKHYRSFVGHVCCRLILKDLITLLDLYNGELREFISAH